MCGLFGYISKEGSTGIPSLDESKWLEQVALASQVRGVDASGVCGVTKDGKLTTFKRAENWSNFREYDLVDSLTNGSDMRIFIGHVRKATMGSKGYTGAQPYTHGDTILTHNGTIHGMMSLFPRAATDSEALCMDIDQRGYKSALEDVYGAFAIVSYNPVRGTVTIARNNQRTLYYSWSPGKDVLYYASEVWMLKNLLARNEIKTLTNKEGHNVFYFDTDFIYELDTRSKPNKGLKFKMIKADFANDEGYDMYGWAGHAGNNGTVVYTKVPQQLLPDPTQLHTPSPAEIIDITGNAHDREVMYKVREIDWASDVETKGEATEIRGLVLGQNKKSIDFRGRCYSDAELRKDGLKVGDIVQAKLSMVSSNDCTGYDIRRPKDQVKAKEDLNTWFKLVFPTKDTESATDMTGLVSNYYGRLVKDQDIVTWCRGGCIACTEEVDPIGETDYRVLDEGVVCGDCFELWYDEINQNAPWINEARHVYSNGEKT